MTFAGIKGEVSPVKEQREVFGKRGEAHVAGVRQGKEGRKRAGGRPIAGFGPRSGVYSKCDGKPGACYTGL